MVIRGRTSLRVMVVDDDPIAAALASDWLAEAGHQVTVRDQAFGVARSLLSARADVLLVDIGMPGMSGDELAAIVTATPSLRDVRVILYSSRRREELDDVARRCGAVGAIEKAPSREAFLSAFMRLSSGR